MRGGVEAAGVGEAVAEVGVSGVGGGGAMSRDPGAFIPRGVGACESSASSPFFGGAVGSRWGEGSGYGACLLRGAPLAQPALRWSFRYTLSYVASSPLSVCSCRLLASRCDTVVVCYK